jgi:hypothetical protein
VKANEKQAKVKKKASPGARSRSSKRLG